MLKLDRQYIVHYNFGFGDRPVKVYAQTEEEAYLAGVAEYRRNRGGNDMLDFTPANVMIKSVEEAKA